MFFSSRHHNFITFRIDTITLSKRRGGTSVAIGFKNCVSLLIEGSPLELCRSEALGPGPVHISGLFLG